MHSQRCLFAVSIGFGKVFARNFSHTFINKKPGALRQKRLRFFEWRQQNECWKIQAIISMRSHACADLAMKKECGLLFNVILESHHEIIESDFRYEYFLHTLRFRAKSQRFTRSASSSQNQAQNTLIPHKDFSRIEPFRH